jgi:glycerol-3-phosphate dehydrogenase (NAD(P)+)
MCSIVPHPSERPFVSEATFPPAAQEQHSTTTILGMGVWGSVLMQLLQQQHLTPEVWSRQSDRALADVLVNAEIVIIAVAMKGVIELAEALSALDLQPKIIVSATKGLDPVSQQTPSQIWQQTFPKSAIVVLSGPNLSQEIAQGLPAATVVASEDLQAATTVQQLFASENFRVYTNRDRLGTELGGTLKNVIAIAVGVCDGLQLGNNARSALITRALPELLRVGIALGGQAETFYGLSGLGDLLATATSPLSRNYQVGFQLAQGKSLPEILGSIKGTAEGVNTARVLVQLAAKQNIAVPIAQQVYALLEGKVTPQEALAALMERDLKAESH